MSTVVRSRYMLGFPESLHFSKVDNYKDGQIFIDFFGIQGHED